MAHTQLQLGLQCVKEDVSWISQRPPLNCLVLYDAVVLPLSRAKSWAEQSKGILSSLGPGGRYQLARITHDLRGALRTQSFKKRKKEKVAMSICMHAHHTAPAVSPSYFLRGCDRGGASLLGSRSSQAAHLSPWPGGMLWRKVMGLWSADLALSINAATSYGSLQVS